MRVSTTEMTSTHTKHTAYWSAHAAADGNGAWIVTWLPGHRLLTQGQAITAMLLAEEVGAGDGRATPAVAEWASELGLATEVAVRAASKAPRGGAR